MGRIRFTLTNVIFWVVISLSCFLFENIALLTSNPTGGFEPVTFYALSGAIILATIFYFVVEHKRNGMTIQWIVVPILLILFLSGAIRISALGTMTFTNSYTGVTEVVEFDALRKFKCIVEFGVGCLMIYLMFFVFNKNRPSIAKYKWFLWAVIILAIAAIGASFILDKETYLKMFDSAAERYQPTAKSFFFNQNTYAACLLIAMFACAILVGFKPNFLLYILMPILLIFGFFTNCLTLIVIGAAFLTAFYLVEVFKNAYKRPRVFTCHLSFILVLGIGLGVLLYVSTIKDIPIISRAFKVFIYNLTHSDLSTFSNRVQVWNLAFDLLHEDVYSIICGFGYGASRLIFSTAALVKFGSGSSLTTTHNGYIQIVFDYGIVGALIYTMLIVYFIYCLVILFNNKHKRLALIYFLCFIAYCAYGVIESSFFFDLHTQGIVVTIMVMLPVIQAKNNIIHNERVEDFRVNVVEPSRLDDNLLCQSLVTFFSSLFFAFGLAFAILIQKNTFTNEIILYTSIIISLAFCWLFVPYLITLWHKKHGKVGFIFEIILNLLIIVGIASISILLYLKVPSIKKMLFVEYWLFPLMVGAGILVDLLICSIIKKGSIVQWFVNTIKGTFVNALSGVIAILCFAPLVLMSIRLVFSDQNALRFIILIIFGLIVYYVATFTFKSKATKEVINCFNEKSNYHFKRSLDKEGI